MKEIMSKFIHGADYNPEQWLRYPEIFEQDIKLLKKANMNSVSIGIFAWAHLEPSEGEYKLDWLAQIIDKLYENGIYSVLATPSGAKPIWMSEAHEEIRRVNKNGQRELSGRRHNHCYTSPYYREKVMQINTKLAQRFASHPGVILWHLSNEYGGECYCPLCQEAFREYIKEKYKTLDNLNHAWWADFWSHCYTDWSQVTPPFEHGETGVHGLSLEWKRFVTKQTVDFCKMEADTVKAFNPNLPVTTNLMGFYEGLDYHKFADVIDIVSWDNYPRWHKDSNIDQAKISSCTHTLMRGIKGENFLLMENTPSCVNWVPVCKIKKPNMHLLSAVEAVANGANSVQYFQFRKSRGSSEKLHGAVVDHVGHSDTRVFREVAKVGETLINLGEKVYASTVESDVAIIYDWDNRWAIDDAQGPINKPAYNGEGMNYPEVVQKHYSAFWEKGINVDIISATSDISTYKVVVAPMLYMFKDGIQEKLRKFTEAGGVILSTYHSGIVNETDLCFLGGWPGEMMDVFGVWNEEIDALWENQSNTVKMCDDAPFSGEFTVKKLCAIVHLKGASALASYSSDFYSGTPALTVNEFGKGKAYYLAADCEADMLLQIYEDICSSANVKRNLDAVLPVGVTAHTRTGDGEEYIFVQNYNEHAVVIDLNTEYTELFSENKVNSLNIKPFSCAILKK